MPNFLSSFFRSRKGVEIAASTMVILIISIVIFGYSMYFLFDMWKEVDVLGGQIDVQTEAQIDSLLRDPRAKVAIPYSTKSVSNGETAKFWIGVKNIGSTESDFTITTTFDNAFSSDGKIELPSQSPDPDSWTGNLKTNILKAVLPKQSDEALVLIKPNTQQKGVYTFKVTVTKDGNIDYGTYPINVVVK